jgi:hypothetical protein
VEVANICLYLVAGDCERRHLENSQSLLLLQAKDKFALIEESAMRGGGGDADGGCWELQRMPTIDGSVIDGVSLVAAAVSDVKKVDAVEVEHTVRMTAVHDGEVDNKVDCNVQHYCCNDEDEHLQRELQQLFLHQVIKVVAMEVPCCY